MDRIGPLIGMRQGRCRQPIPWSAPRCRNSICRERRGLQGGKGLVLAELVKAKRDIGSLTMHYPELLCDVLKVIRFTVVMLVVLTLGLHWAFLQTVAWTGMLVRYSRSNGVEQAIQMTFDGQHPCTLCHAIQKGRDSERQREQQQIKPLKIDFAVLSDSTFPAQSLAYPRVPFVPGFPAGRGSTPPKPPPRPGISPLA